MTHRLRLSVLAERLAVCRLPAAAAVPEWAAAALARPGAGLVSFTRTAEELSLVVVADAVPAAVVPADAPELRVETGFRALRVAGPLDFAVVGVLAALTAPLAEAGVSLFSLSTFDTDYLLVRETALKAATAALTAAGHRVG